MRELRSSVVVGCVGTYGASRPRVLVAVSLAVAIGVVACGQKGGLALPPHAASAPKAEGPASGPLVEPPPAVLR